MSMPPNVAAARIGAVALLVASLGVVHARAQPTASATVNASGETREVDCNGQDAEVNGSSNRLVFHGACKSLTVAGGDNIVEADLAAGAPIHVFGSGNHVLYSPLPSGPAPVPEIRGDNNEVGANDQPATAALGGTLPNAPPQSPTLLMSPAGQQPGAIVLEGDRETKTADCNGRDVLIHASNSRYTLTGGCRSISVQGRMDEIQAQLQPGARIMIGGDTVSLSYTLTQPGPAPLVSVTGAGSKASYVQTLPNAAVTITR